MRFNYSLEDLIIAYRKVKSDIYFDNGYDNLIKLALYEENLIDNIKNLRSRLLHGDFDLIESKDFLGDYKYILKDIEFEPDEDPQKSFVFFQTKYLIGMKLMLKK